MAKSLKLLTVPILVVVGFLASSLISLALFRFYVVTPYLIFGSLIASAYLTISAFSENGAKQSILWKKANSLLAVPSVIWIAVFLFAFVCWTVGIWIKMPSSSIRFPVASGEKIAVDETGRIYCLSRFYNRMQAFDADGRFVRGWFVNLPGGDHSLHSLADATVTVCLLRNRTQRTYSISGELLSTETSASPPNEEEIRRLPIADVHGNIYTIEHPFTWLRIVKNTPEGSREVLVQDPLGLWIVGMLLPFFWFSIAIVIARSVIQRLLRRPRIMTP